MPPFFDAAVIEACRRKSERLAAEKLADAVLASPLPLPLKARAPVAAETPVAPSPPLTQRVAVTLLPFAPAVKQPAPLPAPVTTPPPTTTTPAVIWKAVEKILYGSQINVDDLSLEEQKEFQRIIVFGEVTKLIQPWEPWWIRPSAKHLTLSHDGTRLVQPLNTIDIESTSSPQTETDEIPPGPESPLPSIKHLTGNEPSPLIAVHIIDIIYSYCFTLRLYNGDWNSDCVGASIALSSISSVLGKGGLPETVSEALSYCLEQTCSPAYKHVRGAPFGLLLMDDVVSILNLGGAAIICLLCDMQRMIESAEKETKSEKSM